MAESTFIVTRVCSQGETVSSSIRSNPSSRFSDENKRKVILIWLDAHYDETEHDYQISLNEFQHLANDIHTFIDPDVCINFLTDINDQTKKIILIIDGTFAKEVVPLIEDCSQINSILVFRNDTHQYKEWSKNYPKVKGVFTGIYSLIKCLEQIIDPNYFTMIDIIGPSNINSDYLNTSFMYSQLLKEILLDIHTENRTNRSSFIKYCYEHFPTETININNFDTNYTKYTPIHWYSAHLFIYETVNRALRTVDIDLLLKMSFFIGDLHNQIEELHSTTQLKERLTVYRGQGLTKNECKKLETSIGGFISFNCFLSTSTARGISNMFAESNSSIHGCNGVLFQIEVDPEISSSPFALTNKYSHFSSEDEILFSTHTIFRIDRVTEGNDSFYYVNLSLTNNQDKNLCELIIHRREEIQGQTSIHRLAQLLYRMGKFEQAKDIYQKLLGVAVPLDEILYLTHYIARIDCHMGNFGQALSQVSLALQFNDGRNPALTADVYAGMGEAFLRHDMLEDSLELYQRALRIAERSQTINDHSKVLYLNNIGFVLKLLNHYTDAQTYFQKALDIALARFPPTHPDTANIYQNIGSLYFDKRDFYLSIDYLNKALVIQQLSLPPDHPSLGTIHYNLSKAYVELRQWNEAIYHGQLAVDILKKTFHDDHFEVRQAQAHLDAISVMQRWLRSSDTSQRRAFAHVISQVVSKMFKEEK
ncbi:unnamed protein product [Adineta steineri]|uniref:ADP ribosyltransferase domain-containing protein n=1 Tax=Adineta steineri TaxID=433720 RepID=A0A815L117_9BILA|nr:unnamed protein product [Adineta steineri]CAF3840121.1 unnamed protein product [Adineta steineri]